MDSKVITVNTQYGKPVKLTLSRDALFVQRSLPHHKEISYRQVIKASYDSDSAILKVAYIVKKKNKKYASLVIVKGDIDESQRSDAVQWAEALMYAAYDATGVKPYRKLRVLVNPHGGTKRAVGLFIKVVEPIFREAGCEYHVTHTTHRGHTQDITKVLPLDYDAVITVSGDGLVHEVFNGFANHSDPARAFAIPVAPIPTGSGNGLSLNLLGPHAGFDVVMAALNAVKGKVMKVDLFSFNQKGKRTISFMSQALGLMADIDLGTEHLRWMGDTRFMYGIFRGIIQFKSCPVQLSFKVAERDKYKMAQEVARRITDDETLTTPLSATSWMSEESASDALPPLKYHHEDDDGWTTFDESLLYVYAGKGPYVGRDFMAFPVSLPDDGLIDVMAMPSSSRMDILSGMSGAPKGDTFWNPKVHYVKAHAYRVKPLKPKGYLSVDGEEFPFEEFHVEVHQGMGTLLSPHGRYAADFAPKAGFSEHDSAEGKKNVNVPAKQ
ncbi:ATP-NAD kinase-like domain-containing protein [Cyathus striatus]|nr:ATP-NAD kinase-like domain-containing protein [Cyathus striatus]